MEAILLLGALAVAGGLGFATVGIARAAGVGRVRTDAVEAILEEGSDLYQAELALPFAVRLLGPAADSLESAARAVTPTFWIERIRRNATLAGLGRWGIEGVLALKAAVALAAGCILVLVSSLAQVSVGGVMTWAIFGGAIGFFAPDLWIARRADSRQEEIRRMLPESLDLMAIAVQAGMGLESAIELVTRRLPGALGEEMHRMLQEIQLGASRREALHHLRDRTEVQELSTFALSLAQADALGTPLSEVLRVQASEMRMLRRQRAREHAAKVPVKLLMPLLLGIFPALGIVIIGPAVVSIVQAFGG